MEWMRLDDMFWSNVAVKWATHKLERVLRLIFKLEEGTLHTSNPSLSFETVNLKNSDCSEVDPDVLKYVPNLFLIS